MKDELTEIEDKIWQDIKTEMKRQGITLEKMKNENVFPEIRIDDMESRLGIKREKIKEKLKSLEEKRYIFVSRWITPWKFQCHVYKL